MNVSRLSALLVLTGTLLLAGCAAGSYSVRTDGPPIDPKFALSSYIEEGKSVAFIVGARPAGIVSGEGYMPLEIGVVNKGMGVLHLTAESFTLVDEEGNRYPVVSSVELYREYRRVDTDRKLGEIFPIMRGKYETFDVVPSNFTPSFNFPVELPTPVLNRYTMMYDLIYFPRPEGGIRGKRFELFMNAPELENPVFVQFRVKGKAK
jgi:hypothetical protein